MGGHLLAEPNPQDVSDPSKALFSPHPDKIRFHPPPYGTNLSSRQSLSLAYSFSADQPQYPFYLYTSGSKSQMSDHHVRSSSRDQREPQTRNLRSRSSSRDMSWRKPVPKYLPSPPISPNHPQSPQCTSSPTAITFEYPVDHTNPFSMSLTSLKNDLPPVRGGATLMPHPCPPLVRISC